MRHSSRSASKRSMHVSLFRPARVTPKPVMQGRRRRVVVGAAGRGDLHRQVRPGEGAVPLGPRGQEGREQLLLGARRRRPGPARTGASHSHPAHRPGGDRRFPRRRPGPADHHRPRLQRRADAALRAARQQDPERRQEPQHAKRARPRTSTSCASRTRRTRKRSTSTPRRTSTASSRTTTRSRSASTKKDPGDRSTTIQERRQAERRQRSGNDDHRQRDAHRREGPSDDAQGQRSGRRYKQVHAQGRRSDHARSRPGEDRDEERRHDRDAPACRSRSRAIPRSRSTARRRPSRPAA